MAEIKGMRGLRFTQKAGDIGELVCPPYDIISEEERKAYLARNGHNIIRLELPREGEDPYATAGTTMKEWLESGILAPDDGEYLYIYEEEFTAQGRINKLKGLVCRVKLEEFDKGVVLPHEETLSKAKTDRLNLMKATGANLSSIYSLYFDEEGNIYPQIDKLSAGEPDVSFSTEDGIIHRVWIVRDQDAVAAVCGGFADKKLYIADGHHRYETALNYRNYLREKGEIGEGDHPANYMMMTLVNMEHPGIVVFPTHRIVRDLEHFDLDKLLADCAAYFKIQDCPTAELQGRLDAAARKGEKAFGLYAGGEMKLLTLEDAAIMETLLDGMSAAYQGLDVSILHTLVLERLLGIDKENMMNQHNLTYTRDIAEATAAVDGGSANCAFLINPTLVEEIAAVAAAGEKMPQKSTYFYPKLITGHVMNLLY